jgi:anaerobic dimethyl sulfoxide reductase subunit A
MKRAVEEYGPYSVASFNPGIGGMPLMPIIPWIDFGFTGWGNSSSSGHELAELLTTGYDWADGVVRGTEFNQNEAPDFLNARAIVMWGWNPAVTNVEISYYLMLAKESGIPIIVVDPVYTISAEVYGSQWIPIRAGTDAAALLAIAQVLFAENIFDGDFVARFAEPKGFEEFRSYVMGESDGVPKTPEWAESICGVPTSALRGLAHLVATVKPTYFKLNISVARKLYGESAARLGTIIAAMTGNVGLPGTCCGSAMDGMPIHGLPVPAVNWRRTPPTYKAPIAMRSHKLSDAILLKEELEAGRMTEDEYRRRIGAPPDAPLTAIRVASGVSFVSMPDINKQLRALEKVDFTFNLTTNIRHHSNQMADVILPMAEPFFETARGFALLVQHYISNYFLCSFKSVEPPGEARPSEWIWIELARRFGKAEAYNGRLACIPYQQWDEAHEEAFREAYESWADRKEIQNLVSPIPSWREFRKCPVIRVPLKDPFFPYREQVEGKKPFNTPSGKIEFASSALRDPEFPRKNFRGRCFGGSIPTQMPAVPEWMTPPDNPLSETAVTYPLSLITPHSSFHQNTTQDDNPWFLDEFRHAVWLSTTDAQARSIKEGDLVQIYNDKGEIELPAYVTSRLMPGTVVVRFGAWYVPDEARSEKMPHGIDRRGACNFLTHDDLYPWVVGVQNCSNLVQVRKKNESDKGVAVDGSVCVPL